MKTECHMIAFLSTFRSTKFILIIDLIILSYNIVQLNGLMNRSDCEGIKINHVNSDDLSPHSFFPLVDPMQTHLKEFLLQVLIAALVLKRFFEVFHL